MRQFILTLGTIAALLASCWEIYQGIVAMIRNELGESLFHLLIVAPILMSLVATFDYVNCAFHDDYRHFRKSLARQRGTQTDMDHPHSKEVEHTPWENDSSHTRK